MPRFAYTARDRSGQTVSASLDAPSRKDALRLLTARGLQISRIEETAAAAKPSAGKGASTAPAPRATGRKAPESATPLFSIGGAGKLSRSERLPFLQSLHDLTTSGLSAGEAVRLLSLRIKDPKLKTLCGGIWDRLSEGAPLSRALEAFPEVFDASNVNLIQAGEATGNLNEVLQRLIAHLIEQREMKRQLLTAMAYPAFMVSVAFGVILFFLLFLLPRLQTLLRALGGELPTSTKILVNLSNFAIHYGAFVAVGAAFAAVAFWRWRNTEVGRHTTDAWALRLPLFGPLNVAQTVLAFSQTLSVLLENGITAAEALRMTERQIPNRVHRKAFNEATARVLEGEALSLALTRTHCFPDLVLDQLSVGENTGNVVPSLKKIAATYQQVVTNTLNIFTKVIASAVLMSVFIFVGFLAFAIVSAVFQLSASFNK